MRDKLKCNDEAKDTVVKEYSDILPSYTKYKGVKRNYTLGNGTEEAVNLALQAVSQEIIEFIKHYIQVHKPRQNALYYKI